MINPITQARSSTIDNTTHLARKLEVSRQYLTRAEQGLYEKPNLKILNWTAETLNKSPEEVLKDYEDWRWHHRRLVKESKSLRPVRINPHYNPPVIYYHRVFKDWRELYWKTSHEMCVDLCMHTSPVGLYEEGEAFKMPSILKEVMSRLGLIGEGFKTSER